MKAIVSLLSFVFVLPACGGTLDPIVGAADSGVQDSAADLRSDSPSLPGWGLVPAPTGTIALNAIWGRDASHITIVGHAGTILELQDGAWVHVPSTTTLDLYTVWGLPTGEVYAGGRGGVVVKREESGWTSMPLGNQEHIYGLWAASPTRVFAVGGTSRFVDHFDGTSWTQQPFTDTAKILTTIWGSSPTRVFAAGGMDTNTEQAVYRHDGTSWSETLVPGASGAIFAIWGDASGAVIAAGYESLYFREADGSWRSDREAGMHTTLGLWGRSPSQLYLVGDDGERHFWNGKNLQTLPSIVTSILHGVWGSELGGVWAVGDEGVILHYGF